MIMKVLDSVGKIRSTGAVLLPLWCSLTAMVCFDDERFLGTKDLVILFAAESLSVQSNPLKLT